ncbi:MAG: caspase family protein [Perlabentimonas sp.]
MLSSCATLFYGRHQTVRVTSEPAGARVYVNNEDTKKTTPADIKIKRKQPASKINKKNELVYVLKKDNYHDAIYKDASYKNPLSTVDWYLYVVPGLVNLATGANLTYSEEVDLEMNEVGSVIVQKDTIVKQEIVYVETGSGIQKYQFEKKSDVNKNIPHQAPQKPKRFALIIGNEDYSSQQIGLSSEVDVHFARNDASAFKEYAMKVLGVPERNITFLLDATTGQMNQAIARMNAITRSTYGEAEIFVYYAGHGLPDEKTREAYIMPVDVSGKNATNGIKLNEMYKRLTEHPSKRVTVFIDACFSGGAREQGLLAARAVMVRPRANVLDGNLVVFSGSSGEESALPYKEQHHGFFTYFLLKALKEKGPNVTYGELADHLIKTIELESILVNEKEQTPRVNVSPSVQNKWENWTFN